MPDVVKVGIISLGGAGQAHLKRFKKHPKARVVAVFDPKQEVVSRFSIGNEELVVATTEEDEFFSCDAIEAVSICSPHYAHADHALRALKRGWHVLCEKPLTTDVLDAERIIAEVRRTGLKFAGHHQFRFIPTFARCKEWIASGKVGRVFAIEADYYRYMGTRATQFDDWRLDPVTCPQIALGGGSHVVDLMAWLIGERIIEVTAYANHLGWPEFPDVDTVMALLTFSNGAIGKVTVSTSARRPIYHPLVVMGTRGTIVNGMVFDENGVQRVLHHPKENVRRSRRVLSRIVSRCYDAVQYPFDHNEHEIACSALIGRFIDSVLYDTPVPVTTEEGADAVRVCIAIVESYETGKPVKVKRD